MTKLQIIGAPQSNFVWVTRIVATEKGVDYESVFAMPHTPAVYACNPLGKIPAMRHGEVVLGESRAICAYIDRAFAGPSLIPPEPAAAALTEQWTSIVNSHVDPLLARQYLSWYFFPKTADGKPDRALIDSILEAMNAQIAFLDARVSASGHLCGDTFTLADAYLLPILYYLRQLPESQKMLAGARHLTTYLERHLQRPSVAATIPPPMSELPAQATA